MRVHLVNNLNISEIQMRPNLMIRESMDLETVARYQENLNEIITTSPITVYETPEGYILCDGFHRLTAAKNLGWLTISCRVCEGSVNDAYAAACIANLQHGKPLTRAERERAVKQFIKIKPELRARAVRDQGSEEHCNRASDCVEEEADLEGNGNNWK